METITLVNCTRCGSELNPAYICFDCDIKSSLVDKKTSQLEPLVSLQKPDEAKKILKQAIKDASLPVKICKITDLHSTTLLEIQNHIHQIQNILIAEYVRYTDLKDEIGLK